MTATAKIPGPDIWEDDEPTTITKLLQDVAEQAAECRSTHEKLRAKAPEIARRTRAKSDPAMKAVTSKDGGPQG